MPDSKKDRDTAPLSVDRSQQEKIRHLEDLADIRPRCASTPEFDSGSADEILGHDEHGLPS